MVRITRNSIHSNGRLGIDLLGGVENWAGVTENDPMDADNGPNGLQNCPVVSAAEGGEFLSLQATLNSTPHTQFEIEVFATPGGNSSLPGQGRVLIGYLSASTNVSGDADLSMTIGIPIASDQSITMTATDPDGNTSEFSDPFPVTGGPVTKLVTNTNDEGAGSLRQAILNANATPGPDVIAFRIPGPRPHTIRPASPLPVITDTLLIDGFTQPESAANTNAIADGSNAVLAIEIDGSNAGADTPGLVFLTDCSTVRGLAVNRFGNAGIALSGWFNTIEGCFIGTDVTGTKRMGNSAGVVITGYGERNTIGGLAVAERNVISGNKTAGIIVDGFATTILVYGNLVGTDATGTLPLGNTQVGIAMLSGAYLVVGGPTASSRNVIAASGNNGDDGSPIVRGAGIYVTRTGLYTTVSGTTIGLNAAGDAPLDNFMDGILTRNGCNVMTAPGESPNIISGNAFAGILLEPGGPNETSYSQIRGAFIGTDATGTIPLGNQTGILVCGGEQAVIGSLNTIAFNIADGITVCDSAKARITGNSIFGNGGLGIDLVGGIEDAGGWTENDPWDCDAGPNGLQNHPVLTSDGSGATITIRGVSAVRA